jgi:hypothetical protein
MTAARLACHRLPAISAILLLAIFAVGLALRLWGLDRQTLTHAEVYVPRIEMPDYVAAPPPRSTLGETVLGTLYHDNHPPGYYAFMWLWTGLFGTGLFAIRLPSALVGAATAVLLYWMARPKEGAFVALSAAALLALHGHHLFWSQQARMWVFLAFLGVLSVLLLQSLHRRARATTAAAYVLVVSLGLWLEYSFWPFFAAQIAWEACRSSEARRLPATADLQVLSLVLSSPVLAFLAVHLGLERTGYLARVDVLDHLTGFLLLQWLVPGAALPEKSGPLVSIALLALLVAGTALLIAGVVASRADDAQAEEGSATLRVPISARLAAASFASFVCLAFLVRGQGGSAFAVALPLPWLLLAAAMGASRSWPAWSRGIGKLRARPWLRRLTGDEVVMHALVPVAILLLLSLRVPSVAARSLLLVAPFGLLLVARGLAALLPHPAVRAAGISLLLLVSGVSIRLYTSVPASPHDYQSLAAAMRPLLLPGDVILINDAWWAQPMHYYLPPGRFRTGDFGAHIRALEPAAQPRPARVWVVIFDEKDVKAFAGLSPHLRGYRESRRVEASGAYALLLERASARLRRGG